MPYQCVITNFFTELIFSLCCHYYYLQRWNRAQQKYLFCLKVIHIQNEVDYWGKCLALKVLSVRGCKSKLATGRHTFNLKPQKMVHRPFLNVLKLNTELFQVPSITPAKLNQKPFSHRGNITSAHKSRPHRLSSSHRPNRSVHVLYQCVIQHMDARHAGIVESSELSVRAVSSLMLDRLCTQSS